MNGPLQTSSNPGMASYAITAASYNNLPLTATFRLFYRTNPDAGTAYIYNIESSSYGADYNGRVAYLTFPTGTTIQMHALCATGVGTFVQFDAAANQNYREWTDYAVVYKSGFDGNSSLAQINVNGTNVGGSGGGTTGTKLTTNANLTIFDRRSGNRQTDAQIEDLAFWNIELTAPQIAQVHACRTEADWAALSFIGNLIGRLIGENWVEYLGAYPEGAALAPTKTGTVATVDYGTLATRVPKLRKINHRYRADTQIYTDAGTTAPTTTGDRIYQHNDLSGNGSNMAQTTLANRPYYLNDSGRNKGVVFDNALNNCFFDLPATYVHNKRDRTLVMIGSFRKISRSLRPVYGNSAMDVGQNTGGMYAGGTTLAIDTCDTLATLGWVLGASAIKAKRNLTSVSGSALSTGTGTGGYFGRSNSGGVYADMIVHEVLDIGEEVSDSLWSDIHAYAQSEWGVRDTTDAVILVGTSSMVGTASNYCRDLAWLLAPTMPGVRFFNLAEGSEVIADAITNRATVQGVIDREYALTGKKPAVIVWCGSNDLYVSGDTPATASGNLDTLLGYYVGYGVSRIGLLPILPRGTVGSADNDDRVAYNSLLRLKNRPVAVSDQDARLADGAQTSTTYYTSDEASPRTHLNVTGMGIVAGYVASVVRRLLGGGGRPRARRLVSATGRARP